MLLVLGLTGGLLFSGLLNSAQGTTTSDKRIRVLETKVKQLTNSVNLLGSVTFSKLAALQTDLEGLANATNPANAHTAQITFLTTSEFASCPTVSFYLSGSPYSICRITVVVP